MIIVSSFVLVDVKSISDISNSMELNELDKEHRATLIRAKPSSSPSVHIEFELFPADQRSDYRLHMMVEPLKVVYDAVSYSRMEGNSLLPSDSLANTQSSGLIPSSPMTPLFGPVHHRSSRNFFRDNHRLVLFSSRLKDRTSMELERDYPYKKVFDVTVHLQSVSILLPECGVRQSCVLSLSSFGHFF